MTGTLTVTYMGTDPPTQAVDMGHSSEVDYTALEAEYRQLTGQIHNLGAPSKAVVPEQQLLITAQVRYCSFMASMSCVIDRYSDCNFVFLSVIESGTLV